MAKNTKGPAGAATPARTHSKTITPLHSNSKTAQQQRLLAALHRGPVNTLEARAVLDILHPAGRARELRLLGYPIETHWIERPTDCGKLHRIGEYILALEPGE